ncbi:MAG: acetolactate synthase large subunit [Thiohalocapsa sp.]|nr:acetolactate synthase large subunit [Thiohalocapsa sp.]MCF7991591.1 acetolactate synthase large subunit [Thiohalocapsa sp.]
MRAAELFVRCLENEGVEYIFGIPGEENLDVMDALIDSPIRFVTVRHEQGAAFMADVYGRLTGKPGVCLGTLGPGATNLITGVADAHLDRAPVVAIAGQGSTHRLHKESHQIVDLVNLFAPISKYAVSVREPEIIPEVVRKAFKVAKMEKPGCSFIELPENIAAAEVADAKPLKLQDPRTPWPPEDKLQEAAAVIERARNPMVLAGNGVLRSGATDALDAFAARLNIPVAMTFMAKGAIPRTHPLSLGTAGLSANDLIACGFERSDLVICIGYDMIEYHPERWHLNPDQAVIHIGQLPAEVDAHYMLEVGVVGDIGATLRALTDLVTPRTENWAAPLSEAIVQENREYAEDDGFPLKPQKILWDLRQVLDASDIVISDVGAHKMWVARMWQALAPSTCIISNGFAAMGIGVPGALAAKLVHPERNVVTVTGDAGFMMNSQEIETALRLGLAFVVLIWNDSQYGLIKWHQDRRFGRDTQIDFGNPDFVRYAESFGARGYRVDAAEQLIPVLEEALQCGTVAVVDCPVDYSQNMKLTERLAALHCPI